MLCKFKMSSWLLPICFNFCFRPSSQRSLVTSGHIEDGIWAHIWWRLAGFILLAMDHGGHRPDVAAAAAFDLLDEVSQVLRFLGQLAARPLQELEVFHLTALFPLKAQWVKVEARLWRGSGCAGCWGVTLPWRTVIVRLVKAGEVSVLVTSTSKSPKVCLSASQ